MLWTIVFILIVLWLCGMATGVGGEAVHILLVIVVVIVLLRLLRGRGIDD